LLSLNIARKLKKAGLKWEPQIGDYFAVAKDGEEIREQWEIASTNIYVISGEHVLVEELGGRMVFFGGGLCVRGAGCRMDETHCYCMNKTGFNPDIKIFSVASWDNYLFVSRLDQLLAEIEKRGYWCAIVPTNSGGVDVSYLTELYRIGELSGHLELVWRKEADGFLIAEFRGDAPDEAAAQALLWILEQKEE